MKTNKNGLAFKLKGLLVLISLMCSFANAQVGGESRAEGPSVRSQVAKILLSSLGGAVLGISTLSFYDRPQDHLSNVAVGGTMGAIIGSVFVTKESLSYESQTVSIKQDLIVPIFYLPTHTLGVQLNFEF